MKSIIVVSGLPCTGKSTTSEFIAKTFGMPIFSVDPIEAAMWRSGLQPGHETGVAAYEVAAALAEEHLKLGQSAVIDAVSPIEWSRIRWRQIAEQYDVRMIVIETICPDLELHRQRVERRVRSIPGMAELTWEMVEERRREWEPWDDERLVVDSRQELAEIRQLVAQYIANRSS